MPKQKTTKTDTSEMKFTLDAKTQNPKLHLSREVRAMRDHPAERSVLGIKDAPRLQVKGSGLSGIGILGF